MSIEPWQPVDPTALPRRNAAVEKTITDEDMAELRHRVWPLPRSGRLDSHMPSFLRALRDALVAGQGQTSRPNLWRRFRTVSKRPDHKQCAFRRALKKAIASNVVQIDNGTLRFTAKAERFFYQNIWLP
jgi:hypothetical protein